MAINTTTIASLDALAVGRTSSSPFVDVFQPRSPTTADINYPIQKKWLNTTTDELWELKALPSSGGITTATWIKFGSATIVETLTGNSGGAVGPDGSNTINTLGTANEITVTGNPGTNTLTWSLTNGVAASSFAVNANTAPGTNPVVPTAGGLVTIEGATVAAHSVPIETRSRAANAFNVETQYASAIASTDGTKVGMAAFDSSLFTVDATGFVSMSGGANYISLSPYIVGTDAHSGYSTIALGIAAAVTGGATDTTPMNVYIKPKADGSAYTENLSLVPGVNLVAFGESVTVIGKSTMTAAGTCNIQGLTLQTNGDFLLVVSGASSSVVQLDDCYLNCTNNTGISHTSSNANSQIRIRNSFGDIGTTGIAIFSKTSTGSILFDYSKFNNSGSSTTANTSSAGGLAVFYSRFNNSITTSGTASIGFQSASLTAEGNVTALTVGGSSSNVVIRSRFTSGTASGISVSVGCSLSLISSEVESTNASTITGSGQLVWGDCTFGQSPSTSTVDVAVQIPIIHSNDALKTVTPAAYPYTTVPQDAVILVDTSAARTIIPLASPTTGQKHVIKDSVGSASANNITITPSGKNIDGAASRTIASNYGSVTIVYNGTEWSII